MARVILLPYANPSPRLSEPRLHHLRLAPEAFPGASSYSPWFVQHLLEAYGAMLSLPAPGIVIQAKTFQVEGGKSPFSLLPESRRRITGVFLTWQAAYETTALHVSPVGWQERSIAKGVTELSPEPLRYLYRNYPFSPLARYPLGGHQKTPGQGPSARLSSIRRSTFSTYLAGWAFLSRPPADM
jgi:hypothetical protein